MLTTLDSCERKFFYEYILKLAPLAISPDLHAGGAFAHGIEVVRRSYYEYKIPLEQALINGTRAMMEYWGGFEPPYGHVKTCEAMIGALYYYFLEAFPIETDPLKPHVLAGGTPALEFSFSIPTQVLHPETHDPLLFTGRCDMIGMYQDALLAIEDDKTTKQLGQSWAKQWRLRGQFLGYTYAAWEHDLPVELCVIRGISILKHGYGHMEVLETFPKWQVHRWWEQVQKKLQRAVDCYKRGDWSYSYGEACSSYGGCQFLPMELAVDPTSQYSFYQRRDWNPLQKNPSMPKGMSMKDVKNSYETVGNIHDLIGGNGE